MTYLEDTETIYEELIRRGDPRVGNWLFMQSPVPVVILFILYNSMVYFGPQMMKNREPWDLQYIIAIYNGLLVLLSVYMFTEFLTVSLLANYSYTCQPVDYTDNPLAIRMANVCWWFFFSKLIELLDTVFFILRKKFNQLSFLHVYHHCTMFLIYWSGVKYVAGGQSFFIPMLNSFVHIFVYSYYGLAVLGPKIQKYLWWKKYLTKFQLVQFVAFIIHSGYNLLIDCDFPKGFSLAAFLYPFTLIVLFGNFYYQSYVKYKRT